jgi:SAM-dependent methyltransferase
MPWAYRNYQNFGVFGLGPQLGFNLYVYTLPSALAMEYGTSFSQELDLLVKRDHTDISAIDITNSDFFKQKAIEVLRDHPVGLIKSSANTALNFFIHDGVFTVLDHSGYLPNTRLSEPALFLLLHAPGSFFAAMWTAVKTPAILILFARIMWVLITLFFVIGIFRYFRRQKPTPQALTAMFLILFFLAISLIVGLGVNARYRMSVNPFILAFAGYGVLSLLKREKGSDTYRAKDTSKLVACPCCFGILVRSERGLTCGAHGTFFIDNSNRPILIESNVYQKNSDEHASGVNWLKSYLKRYPKLYYTIWHVFCPVLMVQNGPRKILRLLRPGSVVLDVGSGPERIGEECINVDMFPFPQVDVVADAAALPFRTGSIDGVVSESLMEHVSHPRVVAMEMMRVLRPGGLLYVSAPFIHPYHASPDDFNRWTMSGLRELFSGDLEIVESGVRSGPWSAFLMFLAYWLGVICTFGNRKLAPFFAHFFMLVLGPLKYPDLLFAKMPGAETVAAHLYLIGRKKDMLFLGESKETQRHKLSIIIPCYNESKTIRELLRRIQEVSLPQNWEKEVVVVDDGSNDGTRDILKTYEKIHKIIYQSQNGGKGTAVKKGIDMATGDYCVIQDADLEYNPQEILQFLPLIEEGKADVVYGSRNLHHEKRVGFFISRLGVWIITILINAIYGLKLTDVWTCYKLFPRKAGEDFVLGGFEAEILFTAALARRGYHFTEVPISHNPRSREEGKKIRYRDGIKSIYLIILDRMTH